MVFEIEIDDNLLEPDLDEIEYTLIPFGKTDGFNDINNPTIQECWDACKALRVKGDIPLINGNFKYVKLRSNFIGHPKDFATIDEANFVMKIVGIREKITL